MDRSVRNIESLHRYLFCRMLILFNLIAVMLLSACFSPPEPTLRIATNKWPGYEPLYLARGLGFYDEARVRLVEMTSASEIVHALRSGTLEGAALTLDETLTLIEDGFDLKVILVMDFSHGGDVLLAKPAIMSLADLSGKRVAVEYTAVGAVLLDSALDAASLKVEDIEVIGCTIDEHVECYSSVDAIVTFEPARTQLLNKGARHLFDSSQIPGRIVDVLVVLDDVTKSHEHAITHLLAGYFKAREYFAQFPDDAASLMSARMNLSPEEVLTSFEGLLLPGLEENHVLLSGRLSKLERTASDLAETMLDKNLLKKKLTLENLTDSRFLPGATQ